MAKVRCKFCKFEVKRTCRKKNNATVGVNKKRTCSSYDIDDKKVASWVEKKQETDVIFRSAGMWDREIRRKERRKLNEEALKQYQATIDDPTQAAPTTNNPSHPMTGDLSRFIEPAVEAKDE